MFVEVFLPIIVGELFSGLQILGGAYKNMTSHDVRFAVWTAGVVDIARGIQIRFAVDRFTRIYFKEILATTRVLFFTRNETSNILYDARIFFDRPCGEKAETGV